MNKLLNLLIVLITIITLTGCVIPGKNNGNNNDNTVEEEPADYPYKEYFSNTVYAMQYGGKNSLDIVTHGAYKDTDFLAVGKANMADVTKDTPYSFNDKNYGGLCFPAKTGVEVESVTFTIVAEKECYLKLFFYGPEISEKGEPVYFEDPLEYCAVLSSANFKNYNVTTVDGTKLIKLTPNVPMTFTIDTLREVGEVDTAPKAPEEDFGKITDAFSVDKACRRFLISAVGIQIDNGFVGSYLGKTGFNEFNIKIYNVSFDVKKLEA